MELDFFSKEKFVAKQICPCHKMNDYAAKAVMFSGLILPKYFISSFWIMNIFFISTDRVYRSFPKGKFD